MLPILKEKLLAKGAVVNCDETWCRVKVNRKYGKKYIWCMVNKEAKVAVYFYDDGSRGRKVDEKSSQQLFPVVDERGNTEPIISASSASDFIRALWAYHLSLLVCGTRHPRFLVMDEPAQHAVKEEDLYKMFNFASNCQRQVILFCSTHTITEEYLLEQQKAEEEGNLQKIQVKKNLVKDIVDNLNKQGRGVVMNEIEYKSFDKL